MAKRGPKPKDQIISDGFNLDKALTAKQKRELSNQRKIISDVLKKQKKKHEEKLKDKKAKPSAGNDLDADPDDDGTAPGSSGPDSLYQMLEDMRDVYKRLGGKKRLLKFVRENDKAYELMVKELMKIESAMKQAEIKKSEPPGSPGSGNVFVVLKGLEADVQTTKVVVPAIDGKTSIDMSSMSGIMNPAEEIEAADEEYPLDENTVDPTKG